MECQHKKKTRSSHEKLSVNDSFFMTSDLGGPLFSQSFGRTFKRLVVESIKQSPAFMDMFVISEAKTLFVVIVSEGKEKRHGKKRWLCGNPKNENEDIIGIKSEPSQSL